MRGSNGDTTATYEEDVEATIIEREAAAFLTGKTDERIRVASEELGIPFASLATRVSQSLAIQGKRSSMSLLQMRASAARTPNVLQPEMALAGRTHRLMQGSSEAQRASAGHSHKDHQQTSPDRIREIQRRAADGESVNSLAKRFGLQWNAVKRIITTGEPPKAPNTATTMLTYQQQRQLASVYHTALKRGTPVGAVADRYKVSIYVAKKIYDRFDFSNAAGNNKYGTLKSDFRSIASPKAIAAPRRAPKASKPRHILTASERNQLANAVAKAVERGGPPVKRIAENFGVSWFTAREMYQKKFGKPLPKGGVIKNAMEQEPPKAMAAAAAAG